MAEVGWVGQSASRGFLQGQQQASVSPKRLGPTKALPPVRPLSPSLLSREGGGRCGGSCVFPAQNRLPLPWRRERGLETQASGWVCGGDTWIRKAGAGAPTPVSQRAPEDDWDSQVPGEGAAEFCVLGEYEPLSEQQLSIPSIHSFIHLSLPPYYSPPPAFPPCLSFPLLTRYGCAHLTFRMRDPRGIIGGGSVGASQGRQRERVSASQRGWARARRWGWGRQAAWRGPWPAALSRADAHRPQCRCGRRQPSPVSRLRL
ncbi:uncharacterized protein LOC127238501 [Phodopus roborovskii]|uniref:uncharacterized protein LOC127238501 n=1 Tax=Phodopus roborovskii TaxID=109678 RepID=UPI0021E42DF4|nr:uncharacterized protein LOC127238501 [Phodopus roborovskii]